MRLLHQPCQTLVLIRSGTFLAKNNQTIRHSPEGSFLDQIDFIHTFIHLRSHSNFGTAKPGTFNGQMTLPSSTERTNTDFPDSFHCTGKATDGDPVSRRVDQLFVKLDSDSDARISREEFCEGFKTDPWIRKALLSQYE